MVDLQGQDVVAILTRAPSAGGKTRLFAERGGAPDPDFLAALLLDTLDAVTVPRIVRVVCFTPAAAGDEIRSLVPPGVHVMPQRGDDLGERMRHAFDDLLASGAASVVLVGSDVPGIGATTVSTARDLLHERPSIVVIGPAADGGYYLIGATRTPTVLLGPMHWGGPDVLERTEARARRAKVDIVRLPEAQDVDSLDDLRALLRSDARASRTRAKCRGW
jgi:rSAM/selenodomain-associated transferase 1